MVFETTFSIRRLPADEPGFMAGPDFPPLRIESAVRKSRPACGDVAPWHDQHFAWRMGAISDSNSGALSGGAAVVTEMKHESTATKTRRIKVLVFIAVQGHLTREHCVAANLAAPGERVGGATPLRFR
jgi:hypothetical protein